MIELCFGWFSVIKKKKKKNICLNDKLDKEKIMSKYFMGKF